MLAFFLLSLVLGVLAGAFYAIRYLLAFGFFLAGVSVGFCVMYSRFLSGPNEWGDLAGLLFLFFWAGIGLAAGLAAQMIRHIWKRFHPGK